MRLLIGSACRKASPIRARGPGICSGCSSQRHATSRALGIGVLSLIEAGVSMDFREVPRCGVPMKICAQLSSPKKTGFFARADHTVPNVLRARAGFPPSDSGNSNAYGMLE